MTSGDTREAHRALNRLARLGFTPHRATRNPDAIALWLHDPNGTDVALCLPAHHGGPTTGADVPPEELDDKAVLTDTRTFDQ
jgi:hypothetical protein